MNKLNKIENTIKFIYEKKWMTKKQIKTLFIHDVKWN